MIDLGVLLRVPCVEVEMGFDVSPDGERVAFSWNPEGRWEIYETFLPGSPRPRTMLGKLVPYRVSHGPGGKFHPRYSPDGQLLAFTVDFDGSEAYHLIVHDLGTGEERDLTPHLNCSLQADFSWSPDGKYIAFISDQSGQFDAYIIPAGGGEARLVLDAGYPAWKVRWSPDGFWLAVTVEAGGIDFGSYIVKAEDGSEVCRIADENGPIDAGQTCWSPDGTRLAFTSDVQGFNNIGIYHLATRRIAWLTDGDGEKQFPTWSPDGTRLAYVFNLSTISWLAVQKPGESPLMNRVEPGVHYLPHFTPDGSHIIFAFDNPCHPDDLWSLSLENEVFTQLTHSLPEELAEIPFSMPEEITYPGLDGTPIPALLFRPQVQEPGPAAILIHGGPDWFFEMTWYPLMAHLASRGWAILVPNYRGSTGYGRLWQEASRFDFGGVDNDDVAAGAQFLLQNDLADPERIGITGRSHGGYLTMTCLTKYPHLWAAGSAVVPFINWFTNHKFIRTDLQHWDYENFGNPEDDHDLWVERSPYFFLDKVSAPVQLIAGRLDQRCPVSDSIEAHEALQDMGKSVELVIYEDEGHTFLKLENVLDSELRRVAFLAKYLER
ncbi:MAG TPA: S9 family peptidase [Anaerolineales bacterium]